jgi:alkaline phosphatase
VNRGGSWRSRCFERLSLGEGQLPEFANTFVVKISVKKRVLSLVLGSILFAGCGGGGGSGETSIGTSNTSNTPVTVGTTPPTQPQPTPSPTTTPRTEPKNIIFLIGDGMGFESVRAASVFATGQEGSLSFHSLPRQARMSHQNASGGTTDSAASATAIATGIKVDNGVISLAIPGDNRPLRTLLEHYQDSGKRTGLVTTSYIEDATPAAFAAHESSRSRRAEIAADMLGQSRPHVLMGGYRSGALEPALATAAGYTVVQNRNEMTAFDPNQLTPLAGLFAMGRLPYEFDGDFTTVPRLSEMTAKALDILDADPDGFFLLVENENIDESGHDNHIQRHVAATVEFHQALQEVLNWSNGRTDTLIIVTADHETGGLSIVNHQGQGQFPIVNWSTGGHTQTLVPIYAGGPLSDQLVGTLDNTDFFEILTGQAP